jgi:hypothetical protein
MSTIEMSRQDYINLTYRILRGSNEPVERPLPEPWNTVINHAFEADGDPYTWKEMCERSLNGQADPIIAEVFVLLGPDEAKPGDARQGEAAKPDSARQGEGRDWFTIADAYGVDDDIKYIVDEVILEDSLSIFFGAPGSLKSMFLMNMALCVATGLPFLQARPGDESVKPFTTAKSRVLWLDMDMGEKRLKRRVKALARGLGIPAEFPDFKAISFPDPPFAANNQKSIDWLGNEALKFGAKLLVVDNLLAVAGGVDENSSQMHPVMLGLRYIVEGAGASIVTVHHPTKQDEDIFRGHSSINQNLDLLVSVKRNMDALTLTSSKDRDYPMPPLGAIWEYEVVDKALRWGRFYGTRAFQNPVMQEILKFVEMHPGLAQSTILNELSTSLKTSPPTVRRNLMNLVNDGAITVKDGPKDNAKLYYTTRSNVMFSGLKR